MQVSAVMKAQQSDIVVCCGFTPSSEKRTNHGLEGYLHEASDHLRRKATMTCYNIQCMYPSCGTFPYKCMVKRRRVSNTNRNDAPGSRAEVCSNYLRSRRMTALTSRQAPP